MKAITIHQPCATLIARGYKQVETRAHPRFRTLVDQRIAIHASLRFDRNAALAIADIITRSHIELPWSLEQLLDPENFTRGCVLATARAVGHRKLAAGPGDSDRALCWTGPHLWGLTLMDVQPLPEPIPAIGRQGIWDWLPNSERREP